MLNHANRHSVEFRPLAAPRVPGVTVGVSSKVDCDGTFVGVCGLGGGRAGILPPECGYFSLYNPLYLSHKFPNVPHHCWADHANRDMRRVLINQPDYLLLEFDDPI